MQRRSLIVIVTAVASVGAALLLPTDRAAAQGPEARLPEEVTRWMARDQGRRWPVMIEGGEKLFNEGTCVRCHGQDGSGGSFGPDLTDSEWVQGDGSLENVGEVIFWGVRRRDFADPDRRFQMNPEGGMDLALDERDALTAYVWSLSRQQQETRLSGEVASWLARDQGQRWSVMIRNGEELFNDGPCASCHGEGGAGRRFGPDLTDHEWVQCDGSLEGIGEVIFWGVRRRDFADPNRPNQMHPEGGMNLDADDLDALTAFVWSRSNGTFLPQR